MAEQEQSEAPTFGRLLERNVIYLYEQFVKLIEGRGKSSRSPFVTSLCVSLVIIYLINLLTSDWGTNDTSNRVVPEANTEFFWTNFDSPITEMFTLTPGNILSPRFWIWSAISTITYPLIELHWWQVLNDVIAIYLSSTLIEPLWGSKELFSFFLIINLSVAFLTTSHYIILYSIYGSDEYLYNVRLYGCSAYCAAICVSVKQLLPESVLIGTPLGKFKNNNVPLAALFLSLILYALNIIESSLVLMFFYGFIVSWIYLRFIQNHPNGHRGDLSDGFSFASFFPNVLKPGVAIVSNFIYSFFVAIRLCSPTDDRQYQPLRVLGERLNQEHDSQQVPMRNHKFKHHQSGDYQYLSQPMNV